eukprot:5021701-Prymnesium_polylepis.1
MPTPGRWLMSHQASGLPTCIQCWTSRSGPSLRESGENSGGAAARAPPIPLGTRSGNAKGSPIG